MWSSSQLKNDIIHCVGIYKRKKTAQTKSRPSCQGSTSKQKGSHLHGQTSSVMLVLLYHLSQSNYSAMEALAVVWTLKKFWDLEEKRVEVAFDHHHLRYLLTLRLQPVDLLDGRYKYNPIILKSNTSQAR
ncbi:hypothetical protein CDAR_552331 [Caerostris darwini]|uniref:Reverse transcriptase RNase H-like domain-containing protein n=1 Tax=Caerostris darwini TaxID=1538125 RepID=A0AAV4VRK9_9ARAC|nr:hypothetical protein CDAR_552331 [Caerostris darwini]